MLPIGDPTRYTDLLTDSMLERVEVIRWAKHKAEQFMGYNPGVTIDPRELIEFVLTEYRLRHWEIDEFDPPLSEKELEFYVLAHYPEAKDNT